MIMSIVSVYRKGTQWVSFPPGKEEGGYKYLGITLSVIMLKHETDEKQDGALDI